MHPQVITEVLQDCGSDIDAAIRRLGELQLSANGDAARRPPVSPGAASPGRVTPAPGSAKCPASPVQHGVRGTLHLTPFPTLNPLLMVLGMDGIFNLPFPSCPSLVLRVGPHLITQYTHCRQADL